MSLWTSTQRRSVMLDGAHLITGDYVRHTAIYNVEYAYESTRQRRRTIRQPLGAVWLVFFLQIEANLKNTGCTYQRVRATAVFPLPTLQSVLNTAVCNWWLLHQGVTLILHCYAIVTASLPNKQRVDCKLRMMVHRCLYTATLHIIPG